MANKDLKFIQVQADGALKEVNAQKFYAWLQTVKGMPIAGATAFPPAPFSFEDVVSEP